MADLSVTGATGSIDVSKWKKLTASEIIKEQSKGEEIPAEIINWAQQMAALSQIPDDVTYEEVDGDTGIDALSKLGIEPENNRTADIEAQNAQAPQATEEPDAVRDVALTEELPQGTTQEENIFMNAVPGQAADANVNTNTNTTQEERTMQAEELTLADTSITTDPEEIRKRKARRGLA